MDLDALKELARTAYRKEYAAKTPLGLAEKIFFYPATACLAGGFWTALGAGAALLFGVAALPVLAGGLVAMAAGMPLLVMCCELGQGRSDRALERDIDNGTLIARFQREILQQPANDPGVSSKLEGMTARESFNNPQPPAAENAALPPPAARPAGPR